MTPMYQPDDNPQFEALRADLFSRDATALIDPVRGVRSLRRVTTARMHHPERGSEFLLGGVDMAFAIDEPGATIEIRATVRVADRTGVETEAQVKIELRERQHGSQSKGKDQIGQQEAKQKSRHGWSSSRRPGGDSSPPRLT